MRFFLCVLMAYALTVTVFQTGGLRRLKASRPARGLVVQGCIMLSATLVTTHIFLWPEAFAYSAVAACAHLVVEGAWHAISTRYDGRLPGGRIALHAVQLSALYAAWRWIDPGLNPSVLNTYAAWFSPAFPALAGGRAASLRVEPILAIAIGYVVAVFGGANVVRGVLDTLQEEETHVRQGAGRLIGIMERTVIYALAVADGVPAVGFILAAKSIARFRELEQRTFAEYYLVGTLTSTAVALLTGLAVSRFTVYAGVVGASLPAG